MLKTLCQKKPAINGREDGIEHGSKSTPKSDPEAVAVNKIAKQDE